MKEKKEKIFSVTIKDCEVQTFRCSGHGGQNINKVESGVRIIHHPSGARAESCETRDQFRNKRLAFARMSESDKFKLWARLECARLLGHESIEEKVDRMMATGNLKVEFRDSKGRWTENKVVEHVSESF